MDAERRMPPFDLRAAMEVLAAKDERLARLMGSTEEYRVEGDPAMSPYEALTQAVVYQSISGKAAATIFARVKALGSGRNGPMPQEMLLLPKRALRRAGLSGAKIAAMKDLASALQASLGGGAASPAPAEVLGPAECPLARISGSWRYQALVRTTRFSETHARVSAVLEQFRAPSGVYVEADVDPQALL